MIFYGLGCKETVVVISSDPYVELVHFGFTTATFKPLSDQNCGRYLRFSSFKVFSSDNFLHSFCSRNRHFYSKTTIESN